MRPEIIFYIAANPTLNRNTVHAEIVAFPIIDEQLRIGKTLKVVEQKRALHREIERVLKGLFRTLLHNS